MQYKINGVTVSYEEFRKRAKGLQQGCAPMCGNLQKWPQVSVAAGVHPSQVEEAEKYARSVGVPTHYTKDGDPMMFSNGQVDKFEKTHFGY